MDADRLLDALLYASCLVFFEVCDFFAQYAHGVASVSSKLSQAELGRAGASWGELERAGKSWELMSWEATSPPYTP